MLTSWNRISRPALKWSSVPWALGTFFQYFEESQETLRSPIRVSLQGTAWLGVETTWVPSLYKPMVIANWPLATRVSFVLWMKKSFIKVLLVYSDHNHDSWIINGIQWLWTLRPGNINLNLFDSESVGFQSKYIFGSPWTFVVNTIYTNVDVGQGDGGGWAWA